ncbi:MAG: ABC-type uncharacterized transport system involved in gliding motility auxiliary subunit [Gammaproteobacteria bacterium]|jgi:ABC-type uncharacterized transport system involved in gliding motility auxiliary subunit
MKNTFSSVLLFTLLGAIFLGAMVINNTFLNSISLDLTDQKIYSLSKGSQDIASSIDEPITLYLFFSQSNSTGMTAVRDYKARVESLLQEYVKLGNGNIVLELIDPEPFSDAQDKADSFGLTAAPTGTAQNTIYFGLAGTNSLDDAMVIGFFDPTKETFLEYDISSMLYKLSEPEIVQLTIVSDLQVAGGQNPLTGATTPAYVLYQQLQEMFEVSLISSSDESLPDNTQLLLLWHPQNINETLLQSIDQFLMQDGKALALLDAHYESDPMTQMGSVGANSSILPLLSTYGIMFDSSAVVLDALTGLEVRSSEGDINRHLGFLGLTSDQINNNDITTSDLDSINGASFGTLALTANSQLSQTVLLNSSTSSDLMPSQNYMATRDPTVFTDNFTKGDKHFILAARYSGQASSYFADLQITSNAQALVTQTANINLVVIADADLAADRFWVQQSNFFGQAVFTPFANNGDFILNILENLSGSAELIGVRSRGTFARPFTKVQAIQAVAEEKFRAQEKRLQGQLEQTETQLAAIQTQGDSLALSAEQEAAIASFTEQRVAIRKSLRDVQFQLQRDIDELGNILKLINIVAAPLVLVLLLLLTAKLFKKRAPKEARE